MRKLLLSVLLVPLIFVHITTTVFVFSSEEKASDKQQQQKSSEFNLAEAHKAVERLAELLESDFIYPEIGKKYAEMLRTKIKSGAYSKFANANEFARVVTADLQLTYPEGHLSLVPPIANDSGNSSSNTRTQIHGVGKAGWLSRDVAYMSLNGFTGNTEEYNGLLKTLRSTLESLSTAKTIIIDARSHPGGGMEEMDIMFSYFFNQPTNLVLMDTRLDVERRNGSPTESETLKRVESPTGIVRRAHIAMPLNNRTALNKAKIFVLTSKQTASAGEHLSLALKRTRRATIIGETTAGAGHFGQTMFLSGGYRAFIPVGRTFDPDNGKGWEQTGVEPHIKVSAETALDEALKLAQVNQEEAKKALASFKTNQ